MNQPRQRAFLLPVWSLLAREVLRFLRQRNRIVGALGTPLLFWVALSAGFGDIAVFFPGALLMVVLFTAIFSSISIIEDRTAGFLQGVLVAPVPRLSIVLGKVLGGAILGSGQGMILLLLAPFSGAVFGVQQFFAAAGVMALVALALSGLGFVFAWRMDSVAGFHAVMNLLLIPMWLLSGAFFPASGAAPAMQVLMAVNPLSYGLGALRRILYGDAAADALGDPAFALSLIVVGVFTLLVLFVAVLLAERPESG